MRPHNLNLSGSTATSRALAFALRHHVGQTSHFSAHPMIGHIIAVATLVESVAHTKEMVVAALLHDVVSKTDVTLDEVSREFGADVTGLVYWLTNVSSTADGTRPLRRALELDHIANAPAAAKTIKLAEMIEILQEAIAGDLQVARAVVTEMMDLIDVLDEGDETLWKRAWDTLHSAIGELAKQSRMVTI